MLELMIEMLGYLVAALLIGLLIGFVLWGWGQKAKIAAARADGLTAARTSMDGDSALRSQLDETNRERAILEATVQRLNARIEELQSGLRQGASRREAPERAEPRRAAEARSNVTPLRLEPHMQAARTAPAANEEVPEPEPDTEPDAEAQGEPDPTAVLQAALRDLTSNRLGLDRPAEQGYETRPAPGDALDGDILEQADEPAAPGAAKDAARTANDGAVDAPRPGREGDADDDAEAEPDDLTQIDGIGAITQRVLNENGVRRFDQLAQFSDEDFVWLETVTGMSPGQIDRQAWVDQARLLAGQTQPGPGGDPL